MSDLLFKRLATAEAVLNAWDAKLDNPRFFQPVIKAEWDRAFDAREAARDACVKADLLRYLALNPEHAMAYRYLMPDALREAVNAAETDRETEAAIRAYRERVAA